MPSQVAGNLVIDWVRVLDFAGAPVTGMLVPADVTLTLYRQSGTTMIAASETLTWAEIGATGSYYFSFTPQFSGLYLLYLACIDAGTNLTQREFRYDIVAAGSVFAPAYSDAFCAETDVERYLQQQIDGTTSPSDTQAAAFASGRADALETLCAGLGNIVTPSTVTAGSRLAGLLREANAIGTALDYTIAQSFMRGAAKTERIDVLMGLWESFVGKWAGSEFQPGTIQLEIAQNTASLSTSHVLSGDTTQRVDENAPTDIGLRIKMGDLF